MGKFFSCPYVKEKSNLAMQDYYKSSYFPSCNTFVVQRSVSSYFNVHIMICIVIDLRKDCTWLYVIVASNNNNNTDISNALLLSMK